MKKQLLNEILKEHNHMLFEKFVGNDKRTNNRGLMKEDVYQEVIMGLWLNCDSIVIDEAGKRVKETPENILSFIRKKLYGKARNLNKHQKNNLILKKDINNYSDDEDDVKMFELREELHRRITNIKDDYDFEIICVFLDKKSFTDSGKFMNMSRQNYTRKFKNVLKKMVLYK